MPHSAFAGQTPDEIYFGNDDQVADDLAAARLQARSVRMEANRRESCAACSPPAAMQSMSEINGVANASP